MALSEISAADYDGIYLAGGHGTMWDFRSPELGRLLTEFYESGKIVSSVCHGPVGFLEAKLSDGRWLVQDKEMTAFSWAEEKADNRDDVVPFNLEEELKARGARYTKALVPLGKHVVEDGLLDHRTEPGERSWRRRGGRAQAAGNCAARSGDGRSLVATRRPAASDHGRMNLEQLVGAAVVLIFSPTSF